MFNFFGNDINSGVKEFNAQKNAVLLDVRTREEFEEGHIPKSVNLPLDEIQKIEELWKIKTQKFTHIVTAVQEVLMLLEN